MDISFAINLKMDECVSPITSPHFSDFIHKQIKSKFVFNYFFNIYFINYENCYVFQIFINVYKRNLNRYDYD